MSVRIKLIQWTLLGLPLLSVAQPKQFITSARSGDTVRQSKPERDHTETIAHTTQSTLEVSGGDAVVAILPLFGERPKTAEQINEEIHFLNDCDRNFASRTEASEFFANRGWDYIGKQQLDTATHRFNLAWLLNDKNADAYWGLGVVCYQKNQLSEAIRLMKKGVAVDENNTVLMTDLATLEIKHYQEKPNEDVLIDAETHLQQAVTVNPNALSYQKLSVVYYLKANYQKAWDYFHQASSLDFSAIDISYLNELLAKQPDPKGKFK
ncbi:tetratricopeptide repeat protein [Spirosoma gilvum]